jgi:alpha-tubulin suppressor-like RCC1 family protein
VASKHFVHFLSINGCIYSKGNNNRGQLGLGHLNKVDGRPELNTYLKNNKEIVDCVSVGFKHTVCRTRLGYGYAWGDNSFKQVGGAELFYSQPRLVDIDKPTSKCLQFVAGFRCSVILLENMKMYGWGTNSSLSLVTNPLKIDYEKMFSVGNSSYSNDLMPVKLSCTWSNGISIVYINAIHLNKCRKSPTTTRDLITKTVKQFSK